MKHSKVITTNYYEFTSIKHILIPMHPIPPNIIDANIIIFGKSTVIIKNNNPKPIAQAAE